MSDIVGRLKAIGGPAPDRASVVSSLRLEAAAEIEHLNAVLDQMKADYDVIGERYLAIQAETERLRAALEEMERYAGRDRPLSVKADLPQA